VREERELNYDPEQVAELKKYCKKVSLLEECGIKFLFLEALHLPDGCDPKVCNGLLCPVPREGYPSRLYLSCKVSCPYERNWNVSEARIGEFNWYAFSWKIERPNLTLSELLVAHLAGFIKEK
jgi:hypothetical protein